MLEGALWPLPMKNPHMDESLRPLHLQAGPQFGGAGYFRVTLGIALPFAS